MFTTQIGPCAASTYISMSGITHYVLESFPIRYLLFSVTRRRKDKASLPARLLRTGDLNAGQACPFLPFLLHLTPVENLSFLQESIAVFVSPMNVTVQHSSVSARRCNK